MVTASLVKDKSTQSEYAGNLMPFFFFRRRETSQENRNTTSSDQHYNLLNYWKSSWLINAKLLSILKDKKQGTRYATTQLEC